MSDGRSLGVSDGESDGEFDGRSLVSSVGTIFGISDRLSLFKSYIVMKNEMDDRLTQN